MKRVTVPVLFWLLASSLSAQTPNFDYPRLQTTSEGYIVEQNQYACPAVGDWDNDGDIDLMVGLLYLGYVYYYENISTSGGWTLAPYELLTAGISPISVSFG